MITEDEAIRLAEQIARDLPEVTRNDWKRWVQYVISYDLKIALSTAERLSNDPTIRPTILRSNTLIVRGVRNNLKLLESLERQSKKDLLCVFGYISWILSTKTLRGSMNR